MSAKPREHTLYCGVCMTTVVLRAPTRREAIAMLDDPAVHRHHPSMFVVA